MSAEDLARHLGVSVRTVRRMTAERAIPFYRVGGTVRFRPSEVQDWLEARRFDASQADDAERWNAAKVLSVAIVPIIVLLVILWLTGALPSWWPSLPAPTTPSSPFGG